MVAELVQDLLHLERRQDRFDQHGGSDRAARNLEIVLCEVENVIPQPGLDVALELGQVEVRAASLPEKSPGVVIEIQPEVEEAARDRFAVDLDVLFVQVPAARPYEQRRDLVVEAVFLSLRAREIDPPLDGVDQVDLPLD